MDRDRRNGAGDRRRGANRRIGSPDRRAGGLAGPRTRFTIFYFVLAFTLLIGLNYLVSGATTTRIPYSEAKARIRAGQAREVIVGEDQIRLITTDSVRAAGGPEQWTAIPVSGDEELVPLLESVGVPYEGRSAGRWGAVLLWMLPLGLLILFWIWVLRRMNTTQTGVMTVGKNRARIVGEEGTGVTFADVAGADEAKEELVEVVDFLKSPEKFARLGAKIPKGVLLVGPPGTGKTLLARAVAGEAGVTFFSISGSEFVEMFVGVGAARVRDLFEQAKAHAPCIVFIDELDALGKSRGPGGLVGGHDEREQTLNQLLVEMDGFDPRTGVIIMAATNRPEILDPALLRPGRFDRQVVVDRPDRAGREAILAVHARGIRLAPNVDLAEVARRSPGFVGADLANLLNEAALLAARRELDTVTMEEIDAAIDRVVAGLEKKSRLISEKERRIVAFHEAGHALVAERVGTADPVHKISVIPRGIGALGYTQQLPEEDRYLLQRQELLDRLAVLLGGRAAESLVFEETSTGAGNDLERATAIARRMVAEYGMSDALGPVTFESPPSALLDVRDSGSRGQRYSEATARGIDREVRRLLTEAFQRATEILVRDRDALEKLAAMLLEREVVDREELRELLGQTPRLERKPGDKPREIGHVPGQAAD